MLPNDDICPNLPLRFSDTDGFPLQYSGEQNVYAHDSRFYYDWEFDTTLYYGTFYSVKKARPKGRNIPFSYAVKLLKPEWHNETIGQQVFYRETELGQRISNGHLVPVFDSRWTANFPYLVQPWLEGKTLRECFADGQTATIRETVWVARQMVEALMALEKHNYCHCDVKPANIIISKTGHATLIDLGLARRIDQSETPFRHAFVGTPYYMSPELINGQSNIDIRSDIYSLGMVMLEMLNGKLTSNLAEDDDFCGDVPSVQISLVQRQCYIDRLPISVKIKTLLHCMLSDNPNERPATANQLLRQLLEIELSLV